MINKTLARFLTTRVISSDYSVPRCNCVCIHHHIVQARVKHECVKLCGLFVEWKQISTSNLKHFLEFHSNTKLKRIIKSRAHITAQFPIEQTAHWRSIAFAVQAKPISEMKETLTASSNISKERVESKMVQHQKLIAESLAISYGCP